MATAVWKGWFARSPGRSAPEDTSDVHIEEARARRGRRLARRDVLASTLVGGSFFAVAVPLALIPAHARDASPFVAALLIAAYAVASRVEFEVGAGCAIPTQLVLVPMLFVLPPGLAPLCVAAAMLAGDLQQALSGRIPFGRVPVAAGNAWHAVGPAAVFVAAGGPGPAWSDWPLYAVALGAQFSLDFAIGAFYEVLVIGVSPFARLRYAGWTYLVDLALAPAGLLAAFAAVDNPLAFAGTLPLVALLAVFAQERRTRIDQALELSQAYRGTAFLLGDVVEADDAYTGAHSRDVVQLSLSVADELGVSPSERRDVEFVALLHDVGKIRVPAEIINKPGKLDPDERAVIEQHTLWGEEMLASVGGLLADIGRIVRSHHERWDGGGYPDGLVAEDIPLVARIICCCDAFSAMTTDRAYRRALPVEVAIAELERNAGTQFDPAVVTALEAVVARR